MSVKQGGSYRLSERGAEICNKYQGGVTSTLIHLETELQRMTDLAYAKEQEASRLNEILTNFTIRANAEERLASKAIGLMTEDEFFKRIKECLK